VEVGGGSEECGVVCSEKTRRADGSVFVAYFDDSGSHVGSANVTIGGFVAHVNEWKEFEREWRLLLAEFEIEFVHISEYVARRGPYEKWADSRRVDFMRKLTGIIRRRARAAIAASFPIHNYEKIKDIVVAQAVEFSTTALVYCAGVCWKNLGDWARDTGKGKDVRIASVFEEGDHDSEILEAHRRFKNTPMVEEEWRLGDIGFDNKKCLPLQAADFFAYETHRRIKSPATWRKSVEQIISSIPTYALYLGDDRTDEIVAKFSKGIEGSPELLP
jgi:hypothetical protein